MAKTQREQSSNPNAGLCGELEYVDHYDGTDADVYKCIRCNEVWIMSKKAPCPNCWPKENKECLKDIAT